jgi:hypothetical protein
MADTVSSPVPGPYRETMQHISRVTKILLCVLVFFLAFLSTRTFLDLTAASGSMSKYDYIQYLGGFVGSSDAAMVLFDTRNGDMWLYGLGEPTVLYLGQLTELGRPLTRSSYSAPAVPLSRPWPQQNSRTVQPAPAEPALSWVPVSQY